MKSARIEQQLHGYRFGHELLASSLHLPRSDQQVVDRISDLSGPVGPGEKFSPYLTAYPLPSGTHYVLARTWQDTEARRAGCVLTRSLIIPIDQWKSTRAPHALTKLLIPFARDCTEIDSVAGDATADPLPKFDAKRAFDLVEALFLEKREPIILFELAEAELLSLRVVTALWPNARGEFAFCTFAAGPRTVGEGRPFNLLFAPKDARSRFSSWPGRRVELKASTTGARHRWAPILAKRIFEDPQPSLVELDSLVFLDSQTRDYGSALRLSLLWSELVERSKSSVTSVLGMLDILASKTFSSNEIEARLHGIVVSSLRRAVTELPVKEAWSFILLLTGKLALVSMGTDIDVEIQKSSKSLTERQIPIALEVFTSEAIPDLVVVGIADGIAQSPLRAIDAAFNCLSSHDLTRLLKASTNFVLAAVRETDLSTPSEVVHTVASYLKSKTAKYEDKFVDTVLGYIENEAQSEYLDAMLGDADSAFVVKALRHVYENDREYPLAYFDIFNRVSVGEDAHEALLRAIVLLPNARLSSELISRALRLTIKDIKWLTRESKVSSNRVISILVEKLNRDEEWMSSLSDEVARSLLEILTRKLPLHSEVVANILLHSRVGIDVLFDVAARVMDDVAPRTTDQLNLNLVRRGLVELSPDSSSKLVLEACFLACIDEMPESEIIDLMCSKAASPSRVIENLWMLLHLIRNKSILSLDAIDILSDRLIEECPRLPDEVFKLWALLLDEAKSGNSHSYDSAVRMVFPFAIGLIGRQASALVMAVFPPLYRQLKSEGTSGNLFTFFFNQHWNLSGVARDDLVDAFMNSVWPPADLLLTAAAAQDVSGIIGLAYSRKRGKKYLNAIVADLPRIPHDVRRNLERDLYGIELGAR